MRINNFDSVCSMNASLFYVSLEFVPGNVENPKKEKEAGNKGALAIA